MPSTSVLILIIHYAPTSICVYFPRTYVVNTELWNLYHVFTFPIIFYKNFYYPFWGIAFCYILLLFYVWLKYLKYHKSQLEGKLRVEIKCGYAIADQAITILYRWNEGVVIWLTSLFTRQFLKYDSVKIVQLMNLGIQIRFC